MTGTVTLSLSPGSKACTLFRYHTDDSTSAFILEVIIFVIRKIKLKKSTVKEIELAEAHAYTLVGF